VQLTDVQMVFLVIAAFVTTAPIVMFLSSVCIFASMHDRMHACMDIATFIQLFDFNGMSVLLCFCIMAAIWQHALFVCWTFSACFL